MNTMVLERWLELYKEKLLSMNPENSIENIDNFSNKIHLMGRISLIQDIIIHEKIEKIRSLGGKP